MTNHATIISILYIHSCTYFHISNESWNLVIFNVYTHLRYWREPWKCTSLDFFIFSNDNLIFGDYFIYLLIFTKCLIFYSNRRKLQATLNKGNPIKPKQRQDSNEPISNGPSNVSLLKYTKCDYIFFLNTLFISIHS